METVKFETDGARGVWGSEITPDTGRKIGAGAASALEISRWVMSGDTRPFNSELGDAVTEGLASQGARVINLGILPTPAVAIIADKLTRETGIPHGAISNSASHNPERDAGVKVFGAGGNKLNDKDTRRVEAAANNLQIYPVSALNKLPPLPYSIDQLRLDYIDYLLGTVDPELRASRFLLGQTIAIDAANGAAYWSAPTVLEELGARVLQFNVDPQDEINKNCGATSMDFIKGVLVADTSIDVGFAYDGDADRVKGRARNRQGHVRAFDGDDALVIAVKDLDTRGFDYNRKIVTTHYSNLGLDRAMAEMNVGVGKVENGDREVTEKLEAEDLPLGGEFSGHTLYRQMAKQRGTVLAGDGVVTSLQELQASVHLGQPLGELADSWQRMPHVLINLELPKGSESKKVVAKPEVQQAILAHQTEIAGTDTYILVRGSGTEKRIARILVKSGDIDVAERISRDLVDAVNSAV